MRYYLGLDNGGTNTKAALFDADGNQIAVESIATAALTPAPDFAERDMDEMWEDNCRVIRQLLEKSGVAADEIAGVGLCGHGKGLYLWGKDNRPARNGILSADNRAWKIREDWVADGTEKAAEEFTLSQILACQPNCLLAWVRDNEPAVFSDIAWVFECKDYVRFRLTGEARAEKTDISGSGLLDLRTQDYSDALLSVYGLSDIRAALPPVVDSLEIAGRVTSEAAAATGLSEGTPVIGGMFDIDACALAVNVTDEENICMIAGTWSINEYLRREPVTDGTVMMNSLSYLPEYYLIEESSPTSAGNNQWFIDQLLSEEKSALAAMGESIYDRVNDWVESFSPADPTPVFLPFLAAGNMDPRAKACFLGLSTAHEKRDLARAVYEGIAFSHRYHLDRLLASRGKRSGTIRLAGGAAKSEVWTQMFADVMNMPVETSAADETGALGCAIAVAAALGDYPDIATAAAKMCGMKKPVLPRAEAVPAYEEKYQRYLKAIRCLHDFWR